MPRIFPDPPYRAIDLIGVLALALCVAIGCDRRDPVVRYQVPTKVPEQLVPSKERMLAVMFPKGDDAWFIKVIGPEKAIAEIESDFRRFAESVPFQDAAPDLQSLPENWRRGGEKPMRYASIDVNTSSKQLDISISKLPRRDDWDRYVADNVNRWRGQLGLERSTAKWAEATEINIAAADAPGVWVDLLGDPAQSDRSMSPPLAAGSSRRAASQESPSSGLQYEQPEGWRAGRTSQMRLAAFKVGDVESEAEVTVIRAGGEVRENVARWLGQLRGGRAPEDAVVDQALNDAQQIDVSGYPAKRFLLSGDEDEAESAIDATIVPLDRGASMFIKMSGPVATVEAHSDELTMFLQSLKF